jgi:hypothetical protein
MNTEYIKNYRDKELKQYILAYLLITISSVGFYTEESVKNTDLLPSLFSMAAIDVLVGSICVLVFVLNELWSDKAKTKIVYRKMPSDTVFSDIASGKIDATGFDLVKAQRMYTHMSKATANQQTAEWNRLLKKSRDSGWGNVIEAERLQLMTRDICMSTVSLLIMTGIVLVVLVIVSMSVWNPIKMLAIPLMYLVTMLFVSRTAAKKRADRLVTMVVKNDVQSS